MNGRRLEKHRTNLLQNDKGHTQRLDKQKLFHIIDDVVVINKKKGTHIKDLAETFANMHGAQLKLNPEK
jgi:hypothetical protein